ncbi:metal-sensitive transcriptional regulator [Streptomyces sp. Rer75]|uniref:metal-sensitive transcriptional regulator n=1 Tax=Streptomyces sp. Rer75 TaxID=2750011 RepID=UPI0015D0866D|nr:metal-sensitive transcriptional regulator [Streptomyces sp. Rer75]QLH25296.1 metal-sensitive transcriptional regulator [Streptomyces sp. Rer75]
MTTTSDHGATPAPAPPGYTNHKPDHLARLHKIEGQTRGVTRMVTDNRYCIDVLTQISAVTHALQEVALGIMDDHVRHCVTTAVQADPAHGQDKLDELTLALRRTLRL